MLKIPEQLKNPEFRFVLLGKWNNWGRYENKNGKSVLVETKEFSGLDYEELSKNKEWKPLGKAPYEPAWQKNGYSFDNPKLLNHQANFGIIGGYGKLRILDIDDSGLASLMSEKLNTFAVKTGSGGTHFYFISEYNKNHVLINELGELRANNYQVVCSPSIHPSKNQYQVIKDMPIQEISSEELYNLIKPYLREEKNNSLQEGLDNFDSKKDTSRSAYEMQRVCWLVSQGFSKKKVWEKMQVYSKWFNASEQYREMTYQKALEYVGKGEEGESETEEENFELEVFTDKDLLNYTPKNTKWLIENQIPLGEIGLLVGKRGERKTFTALVQALCLSSGKDCFNDKIAEPKKVVFVSEEDSIDTLASRIKALKKGMGLEKQELPIKYLSFNGLKLDTQNVKLKKFKELLAEFKPDLVIIDALQRCVTFEVDKDNRAISQLFTEVIRPLMKEFGGTWLFISHLRKTQGNNKVIDELDEVRGGSELVNYCRFVLMCEAPRYQQKTEDGADMIIFKVLKMSSSQIPEPKVISYMNEEDCIRVSYEGIPAEVLAGEVQSAKAIQEWLMNNQITEFKTKTINDASEEIGFKKTLISYGLKLLIKQGIVKKVKRGMFEVVGVNSEQKKIIEEKEIDFTEALD